MKKPCGLAGGGADGKLDAPVSYGIVNRQYANEINAWQRMRKRQRRRRRADGLLTGVCSKDSAVVFDWKKDNILVGL